MNSDLQTKILSVTNGSKLGAILRCALVDMADISLPRFVGKASVTSDGFVMCDFISEDGEGHHGAFVGSLSDLDANVAGLAKHLSLNAADREQLLQVVTNWIGKDWRPSARVMQDQQARGAEILAASAKL